MSNDFEKGPFVGALVPDRLPRGRSTGSPQGMADQARQAQAVRRIVELELLGATRTAATEQTAKEFHKSRDALDDLYEANLYFAVAEIVEEFQLMKRTTDAAKRGRSMLERFERNRARQLAIKPR